MKKAKKLMIATAFLFSVALTGAAIGSLNNVSSDAAEAEKALLSIDAGASIRVDTLKDEETGEVTGYDTGIRFTATASQTLVSSLVETTEGGVAYKDGAELGMFIVPKTYLAAYNAQKNGGITDYFDYFSQKKGLEKSQFTYVCSADELNATGDTNYNVSILKLYEQNYNRTYQAVAYYTQKTGDTVTYYYTDTSDARTVSYVADAALLDPDGNYSAEKRKALGGIIERALELKLGAIGTGNEAEYFGAVHGDTPVKLQESFTPEITASDLTFTVKSGAENLSITKGTATATAAGTATMNVSAYGGLVDFDVTMKTLEKQDNEVLDFAGANDMVYNTTNEGDVTGIEYVEEYQGANGVLKVTAKNWGRLGFDPVQAMDAYAGYKYLVIRMWADTTATDGYVYIDETNVGTSMTTLKTGSWVNYYFDAETFRTQWADLGNYFSSMSFNRAGTYYIDKIYVTNNVEVIDFDDSSDLEVIGNKQEVSVTGYLDSLANEEGVVEFTGSGNWIRFGFPRKQAANMYANNQYLVVRMYVEETVANSYAYIGINGSDATCRAYSNIRTGSWVDYYFNGNIFYNQWTNNGDSNWYSALAIYGKSKFYISEVFVTNVLPNGNNGEIVDFASSDDISKIAVTNGAASWVDTDGTQAGGYMKVDYTAQPSFSMNLSDYSKNYLDYKWLVLRANFKSGSSQVNDVNMNGSNEKLGWIYNNKYVNYVFDISSLATDVITFTTVVATSGAGTFYVDEIYLLRDVAKSDLSIATEGTLTAGETISVSLVNPNNASYLSMTVAAPDGSTVTNLDGFTAVAGTYTVIVQLSTNAYYDDTNYVDELRNIRYYSGGTTNLTFTFTVA